MGMFFFRRKSRMRRMLDWISSFFVGLRRWLFK